MPKTARAWRSSRPNGASSVVCRGVEIQLSLLLTGAWQRAANLAQPARCRSRRAPRPRPRAARQHLAPRIDDHRVAVGAAAVLVRAALRGRDRRRHWFSTARARSSSSQCARPVVHGEGRGHEHAGRTSPQRAVQLGKAQVVADRQAERGRTAVDRDRRAAGLDRARLVVALVAALSKRNRWILS